MKSVSTGAKIGIIVGLIVMIIGMGSFLILRDYNIEMVAGKPTLVAKINVPLASGLTINNSEEKKLIVKCSNLGNTVKGYEFKISSHQNMMFGHTYRSEVPKKEIGKLKPGKQYYVQVRCYKDNPAGRSVNGMWSGVSGAKVKEDPIELQKRMQNK